MRDWREGAVLSRLGYGGNRSPELVEGNAEGQNFPVDKSLEKTSPGGASVRKQRHHYDLILALMGCIRHSLLLYGFFESDHHEEKEEEGWP